MFCIAASLVFFFLNYAATPELSSLSPHAALPLFSCVGLSARDRRRRGRRRGPATPGGVLSAPARYSRPDGATQDTTCRCYLRSEEHTSELQSRQYLVCRLLLEKKK